MGNRRGGASSRPAARSASPPPKAAPAHPPAAAPARAPVCFIDYFINLNNIFIIFTIH